MICPACLYVHEGQLPPKCTICQADLGGAAEAGPFVGRGRALAWLEQQLQQVSMTRTPRFVVVAGQQGVGRRRLLEEFQRRADNPFSELEVLRGFPVKRAHAGDPFRPFGRLLHVALGLDERMPPEQRHGRLEAAVEALRPPAAREAVAGLARVLGLSLVGGTQVPPHSALRWYLGARARKGPLLVLLESLDQAGADGLRLFATLRAELDVGPMLVVATCTNAGLTQLGLPADATLMLAPLARAEVAELLGALTGRATAPPLALLDATMAATGGRPGGVFEAAHALIQAGITPPDGGGWGLDEEVTHFTLPLTRAQEAGACLAALDEAAQQVLGQAAFVGPVCWLGCVVAVLRANAPLPASGGYPDQPSRADIRAALEQGCAAGALERRPDADLPGEPAWGFVDADIIGLLHDRQRLALSRPRHRLVAAWLSSRVAEASPADLRVLAGHHQAGGDPARAADVFAEAGARLRAVHAVEESIAAYDQALVCLEPTALARRIEVQHALGVLHDLAGRPMRSDACFEAMLADAWRLDHRAKAGAALNRLGRSLRRRSRYEDASRVLERGRVLFAAAGDAAGVAASVDDLGQVALLCGDLDRAVDLFREALKAREGDARAVALSLTNIGRVMREAGDPSGAEASFSEAAQLRAQIDDMPGLVDSWLELAELRLRADQLESAQLAADGALNAAREIGSLGHLARALAVSALLVMARTGATEAALMARESLALAEQLGDAGTAARALRALALSAAEAAPENALTHLERAIERARRYGDRFELAASLRMFVTLQQRLAGIDLNARAMESRAGAPLEPLDAPIEARLQASATALDEAVGVLDAVNDRRGAMWCRRSLAQVVESLGDVERGANLREIARARQEESDT
jgi:tetratricopeptide (TPR) repeat protein